MQYTHLAQASMIHRCYYDRSLATNPGDGSGTAQRCNIDAGIIIAIILFTSEARFESLAPVSSRKQLELGAALPGAEAMIASDQRGAGITHTFTLLLLHVGDQSCPISSVFQVHPYLAKMIQLHI